MIKMRILLAVAGLSVAAASAASAQKVAHATRIDGPPPRVDGVLDDAAWQLAEPVTDFVQKTPNEGGDPSVATEVRLLFDGDALYVGARLLRPDADAIRTSITRRDGDSDAEVFTIALDPYLDHRTAYAFAITSGGVRGDWYHSQDSEDSGKQAQYDPIWSARARVNADGWTAEMRIPFSQLRYNSGERQVWGLQLKRTVPDKNEKIEWTLIPTDAAGFASRFGTLEGIASIPPSRRLELMPYVAGDLTYRADQNPDNPFNDHALARAGGDLKMGLGPNLTLDATVNPDFGQVEADPAEVNLTAFETVQEERRPFFVEGNELLTGRGQSFLGRPTWFYTRRVGAPPRGVAEGDFVKQPANTTIVSAAKVTGRLASGLSIGALAAVTPREYAETFDTIPGRTGRVAVEPPSEFGVVRLQQEFGKQQSNFGLTLTQVHRSLDERGALESILARNALAAGLDWKFRFNRGMWEVTGWAGGSRIDGDSAALNRIQRNSAHYFQRPDQDHLPYDPRRTALSGWTASLRGDKNAGRFTLGGIQLSFRSPGFEINDAGQMRAGDDIDFNADIQIRDTKPHKLFRYFQLGTSTQWGWNFGGIRQYTRFNQSARVTLHNFWTVSATGRKHLRGLSDELTRGGPLMTTASAYTVNAQVTSRPNVPRTYTAKTEYFTDELGGWRWDLSGGIVVRPASRWQASVDPTFSRSVDPRQYVTTESAGRAATFGRRYVFAFVERSTLSARFRLNYALTPNFTVEAYAEPFAASGRFYNHGELESARSIALRTYGAAGTGTTATRQTDGSIVVTDGATTFTIPPLDFNRLSFRSNLVLRWEWLPGSTAYLIWQRSRLDTLPTGALIGPGDLWEATRFRGDNFLALKVSYWIGVR